jgi:hypothetical protein
VLGTACSAAEQPAAKTRLPKIRIAADGRTFETEDGKPFVPLGVNYYRPGTGWAPQLWKKFDAEATRADFARMKTLGVNCVRVFLTYGSFFMQSDALTPDGLAKFDQFLAIAEEAGIYIHPTGPDHWEGLPPWAAGDRIAEERVLRALENFWKLLAARYRDRNVIFAYDLLNEPEVRWDTPAMREKWNRWLEKQYGSAEKAATAWGKKGDSPVFATMLRTVPAKTGTVPKTKTGTVPKTKTGTVPAAQDAPGDRQLLDYQRFREEIADEWTRRQAAAIKSADPRALVTVGMIQWSVPAMLPGVQHYAAFRPERQAKLLDFLEIHFYPLADGFFEYAKPEDEERNLAYLESVVREVAAAGKPVVVAEFGWYGGGRLTINGGKHPAATEEQQARWCRRAIETTRGLATGWLNWGFYDHPEARDVSQLTGLLTVDGKPKAWANEFQRLSGELAGKQIPPAKLGPRPTLDWDAAVTSMKAAREFREEYYKAFERGHTPPTRE